MGGSTSQIIDHRTFGLLGSSVLTLKNLIIRDGYTRGANDAANGGAIKSYFQAADPAFKPTLNIENVSFINNDSTLDSFTGGNAYDFGGGAIFSQGGQVNITDSTFRDNDANNGAGGALHMLQSGLTIANTTFTNNTAIGATIRDSLGGAIYNDGLGGENSRFTISGSRFENNRAYNSGGAIHTNMYENSSALIIDQTAFVGNAIVGGERAQGGAIGGGGSEFGANTGNPSITITRSLFASNTVQSSNGSLDGSGGALAFPQRAIIVIENSTFNANRAEGSSFGANGGALYVVNNTTPFQIRSSTFANNYAGWIGGAVSNSDINKQPGGSIANTLLVNNTAGNGVENWNIQQHCGAIEVNGTYIAPLANGGGNFQFPDRNPSPNYFNEAVCSTNITIADPRLQPLASNGGSTQTMAIGLDSPALDSASGACPATDQRGTTRPQGAKCDSGALELVQRLTISPTLVSRADGEFTLTVRGAGFTSSSKICIAGVEQATTFVDAATLTARIDGSSLPAGRHEVSVSGSALNTAQLVVVEQLERVFLPLARR